MRIIDSTPMKNVKKQWIALEKGRTELPPENPQKQDMRYFLDELHCMQSSEDLFERYQCFIRMVEKSLRPIFGDACVTLWCPDEARENLFECVIKPSGSSSQSKLAASYENELRHPCRVPLESSAIRKALQSGTSYVDLSQAGDAVPAGRSRETALAGEACIPLYRDFGQPLLVHVKYNRKVVSPNRLSEFEVVTHFIKMFWEQLQATNQRVWKIEHDPASGALREEAFLKQAQVRADQAMRLDALFSFVVISIHGFRAAFAGQSRQWRQLFGQVGKCLQIILSEKADESLLGKMADDVYALMLSETDEFLANSVMNRITIRLEEELKKCSIPEWMALDLRWAGRDYRSYRGQVEPLLNQIYRDLFRPEEEGTYSTQRIILNEALMEKV